MLNPNYQKPSFIADILEGNYLSASKIKMFVLKKYDHLGNEQERGEGFEAEWMELKTNLAILNWIKGEKSVVAQKKKNDEKEKSSVTQWVHGLKNNAVINHGFIAWGTGKNLDWLDENDMELNGFRTCALESILKIVEVKRKKIIKAFPQDLTQEEKICEGLSISILLSRAAHRHKDLRFLNAAFKLNDWYYPILRSAISKKPLINYLLALSEQEKTAAELLR